MKEKFSFRQFVVKNFWKKFWLMTVSIILMGFFISFLIQVGWGTDPASFMNLNIAHAIGWTFGNWQLTMYMLMFIIEIVFAPKSIGFGTIFNMVLIGYSSDFFCWLWKGNGLAAFISEGPFAVKLAVFVPSIICFVIVAAIYMNAKMGLSPYDGCAKLFAGLLPKVPFFIMRIVFDVSCVVIGFVASRLAPDGIQQGSVLCAAVIGLLLGPAISLIEKPVAKLVE